MGFESPPLLASFCIFASAVVDLEGSPLPRRLRLVTQAALSLLVLSTLSRGAIAFFAMLALRAAYARWGPAKARWVGVGSCAGCIAIIAALTVGRLHLDPARPSTVSYQVPDPGNRREAFVTGLDTFAHHPLVGKGPGSLVAENRGLPFRAHFTPFNVAATLGLPALAALVFLVVVLWRERRRPTSLAIWTGLAGLAIDGLAQDIEHFRHVWVMVGLADAERAPRGLSLSPLRTDRRVPPSPAGAALSTRQQRHDLAGEKLDLTGRRVDGQEQEGVEPVLREPGERLGPPFGRPGERFADLHVANRQPSGRWRPALADDALHVEQAPDLARITAGGLGGGVDPLVAGSQAVGVERAKRRDPAIGLAPDEPLHPRLERAEPEPDRMGGPGPGMGVGEAVVATLEGDDVLV